MRKLVLITLGLLLATLPAGARIRPKRTIEADTSGFHYRWHPYLSKMPAHYWNCLHVLNNPERNSLEPSAPERGLRHHLLTQSLAGLVHRAAEQGKTRTVLWMGSRHEQSGYGVSHRALDEMGLTSLGEITAYELATRTQELPGDVRHLIDGYVLTDLEHNPESNIVASVAAHVYNALIVDIRDRTRFDEAGYRMLYDAREKTTRDAWREFRDRCDNRALVLMPVNTGELREFAIANNLFVVNLNHVYADPSQGDNFDLFEEILAWLRPNSPVYGWDQGIDENRIADCISRWGNQALPYDWGYNTTLTSVVYPRRQAGIRVRHIDPSTIDYASDERFVSYYLTDGDNIQWMMGGFDGPWYGHPLSAAMRMSYGVALANTSMIGPSQMASICDRQSAGVTLFERCSYFFLDTYATRKDRLATLQQLAEAEARHMREHNCRILGTVTLRDAGSAEALEGYRLLIEANDRLDGILAIQYSPYADGKGRIFWFRNKKGYEIPVICTKFSIWNTGSINHAFEGSPAFVARKLRTDTTANAKFSLVCVHAWSKFLDRGTDSDETAENLPEYEKIPWDDPRIVHSAGAAELCARRLGDGFRTVNAEELIWRIRMEHNPEETRRAVREWQREK